ncbi:ferrochelatase [bacterium]|nr:ferrochelatase [bacterium]
MNYDALILMSFGGPNAHEDVMPFLENVTRGRRIPHERLLEVAEHYHHFGGKSPINEQNLALVAALRAELERRGHSLPVYWGNRNWHPYLTDTLREMQQAGVKKSLAFFTSAFSSYSGCRQYHEDIQKARAELGEGAPTLHKLGRFFSRPGFLQPMADGLARAVAELAGQEPAVLFTAHSIPNSMASNCAYEEQLQQACRLCHQLSGVEGGWELVYQSRSGPPQQPWLEPDVCDRMRQLHEAGTRAVVLIPIGFISDHMEVLFDLDTEAAQLAEELGMGFRRVATVGVDPRFVSMIVDLVEERCEAGDSFVTCAPDCCPAPSRG